jgi:hypothetical protein
MAKMGRPTILSAIRVARAIMVLRLVGNRDLGSAYAGINKDTFYTWLKKAGDIDIKAIQEDVDIRDDPDYDLMAQAIDAIVDWELRKLEHKANAESRHVPFPEPMPTDYMATGDGAYVAFRDAVEYALAQREFDDLMVIQSAGRDPKLWQARAWLLQQRHPDKYQWNRQGEPKEGKPTKGEPAAGEPPKPQVLMVMPSNGRDGTPEMGVADLVQLAGIVGVEVPAYVTQHRGSPEKSDGGNRLG